MSPWMVTLVRVSPAGCSKRQFWQSIDKTSSWSHHPMRCEAPWPRVKSAGPWVRATSNHLNKWPTNCAVNSPPPSLLIDCGTPKGSISSINFPLTSSDPLEARGYLKRNLLALSTTTSKYGCHPTTLGGSRECLFLEHSMVVETWPPICSCSSFSFGGTHVTAYIYCRTSFCSYGQPYLSLTNSVVQATPGWPKVLWTRDNTPGINVLAIAKVFFFPGCVPQTPLSSARYSSSP